MINLGGIHVTSWLNENCSNQEIIWCLFSSTHKRVFDQNSRKYYGIHNRNNCMIMIMSLALRQAPLLLPV